MANESGYANLSAKFDKLELLETDSSQDEIELNSTKSAVAVEMAKIDREIKNTKERSKLEQKDFEDKAKKAREDELKQAGFTRQDTEKTLKERLSRLDIELKQNIERLQFERQAAEKNIKQGLENLDNDLLLEKQRIESQFKDQMSVVANWEDRTQRRINELEDIKMTLQMDGEKKTKTLQAKIDVKEKRVSIIKQAIADIKEMAKFKYPSSK